MNWKTLSEIKYEQMQGSGDGKILRIGEYFEDDYHTLSVENGIVHGLYKPLIKRIDLDLAKKLVWDRKLVTKGNTYPVFVDLCRAVMIKKDARKYFSSPEAIEGLAAVGILVKNQITKHGATIWNMIEKPVVPTKIFTEKEEALKWLAGFRFMS